MLICKHLFSYLAQLHMNESKAVSNPQSNTYLIIVMGVSGSGKSSLGKELADIYGFQYLDGDDFHSDDSRRLMAAGMALTDANRAPWVASIKQVLENSATTKNHMVLAFSGLKQNHRNLLRSAGLRTLVLYLSGDKHTIQARIGQRQNHFMPSALLDSQFASMEDPLNEPDVYLIDVRTDLAQVVAQARQIIDSALLPHT